MRILIATTAGGFALALVSCGTPPAPIAAPMAPRSDAPVISIVADTPAASTRAARQGGSDSWHGGFSGMIGYRQFDEDDFDPVDKQVQLGVEFDFRPPDLPIGIEFGLQYSIGREDDFEGTGVDIAADVGEIYVGPRLTLDVADRKIHPYLGAGVTFLRADAEFSASIPGGTVSISDDDTAVAGYAHVGLLFDVGEAVHLGIDGRAVFGSEYTFDFGTSTPTAPLDGDYLQLALVVGTYW